MAIMNFLAYALVALFLICMCVLLVVAIIAIIWLGIACVMSMMEDWRNIDGT